MTSSPDRITYLARTNHRNAGVAFGIRGRDRRSHFYVVGKTGTGKSHLLRLMILQDIAAGVGCALFDPHGDLVTSVRDLVASERTKDVIFLDLPDPKLRFRFNPFADVSADARSLAASGIVDVFRKLWPDEWGPRLEHLLRNVVFTLLETPNATLANVPLLLTDQAYRRSVAAGLENEAVRDFWFEEFNRYSPPFRAVVVAPLQNKLGALLTDPVVRRFFTEDGESLDLKRIMNEGKVLLVNLDKGQLGEGPASMIGSLLVSHIALVGLERSKQREELRPDFFVYLDEFHTFTTAALTTMLSELRKYRVGLVLAHQYLGQLDPRIRDAVFGNVGTMMSFRVGAADAGFLAKEFAPTFGPSDLTGLPRFEVYIRLQIDGEATLPFSATTLESLDDLPLHARAGLS